MEKISSYLCFIILAFLMISCNKGISNSYPPYEIAITNISKKERNISVKVYKKINNNKESIIFYTISTISTNGEPIKLKINANNKFYIRFSPYEDNIEDIGKEKVFYYEIYEDNKLIINKKITIKSSYLDLEEKDPWGLNADLFKIENKDYVKGISKTGPSIELEF
ncbi:hypothetical protein [Polaribacter cellanae]|uniref:Uncharacterized protein n=1 Tax=Polaribacter cellanae TaxID=2818493 RepID=A0A975H742_9FLAO|nr:hypothetical protein [Polaribacter cellanae]QTE23116.1 hypothetical protein J3359_02235 [Polaribacter cellanae]